MQTCLICEEPIHEPPRSTRILTKYGGKYVRSLKTYPICNCCYSRGDYSSLACAVINAAIDDYCNPKLDSVVRKTEVTAHRMSAKGFLFSDNLDMWAELAGIDVKNIRISVEKRHKEFMEERQKIRQTEKGG